MLKHLGMSEVDNPAFADALVIQEAVGYKNWRYITQLLDDPLIGRCIAKTYTINQDDCATGLLKGAYTSLPRRRFDRSRHCLIPYPTFPNPLIATTDPQSLGTPTHLASWRGNPISCPRLRKTLLSRFQSHPSFLIESSQSWLNHGDSEISRYVEVLAAGLFSLCPRGWSPMTYRLYESLAFGRVPVILAEGIVLPDGLDWPAISLQVPEHNIRHLPRILEEHRATAGEMGQQGRQAWLRHFGPAALRIGIAKSMGALIARGNHSSVDPAQEVKRLKGLAMAWSNRWTPPQRLLNRAQKLFNP